MRSMQVRTTQLQDATAQLEVLASRSRELRLRMSDLQAREQQVRELRYQPQPGGPDRASLDRQWLDVRHSLTAATLELEAVNDKMGELRTQRDQAQREQARVAALRQPPPSPEPPPVEVAGFANAGFVMLVLFVGPVVLLLVYRLLLRRSAPRAQFDIESSAGFQRLEQTVETIAIEVERIAEGQRFTTAILAERLPSAAVRGQATPPQGSDPVAPH
jgi:hypothetical protein